MAAAMINLILKAYLEEYATAQHLSMLETLSLLPLLSLSNGLCREWGAGSSDMC
jgi:hypothetical protein